MPARHQTGAHLAARRFAPSSYISVYGNSCVRSQVAGLDSTTEGRRRKEGPQGARADEPHKFPTKEAFMASETAVRSNTEIIREYTQRVFNAHNPDLASEYLTPEVKWHGGLLGTVEGLGNVTAMLRGFIGALPDLHAAEEDMVAAGDTVAMRYVV